MLPPAYSANDPWRGTRAVSPAFAGRTLRERVKQMDQPNPKRNPRPDSNTVKDPSDWVSGDEPMTGAQKSYLKTLSEEAGEPDAFDENLTKAAASERIDALKARLGTGRGRGAAE